MRVAIQGFGNAGQNIARLLAADGHSIVAVSDSNGAVKADGGLDIDLLVDAKARGNSVAGTAGQGGHQLPLDGTLGGGECDLLVRAARAMRMHKATPPPMKGDTTYGKHT